MIQHRSIQEMNSAITPPPALSPAQMTPEKAYCPKHPIGAQSESALFSFLGVYPLLVSVVGQLEQAELLNLILTSIQTSTEKCKFCHGLLLCCVSCRLEFHQGSVTHVEQVHETAKRAIRICLKCNPKLPKTTTSDCCKCNRSIKCRFICKECTKKERKERTNAKEPYLMHIASDENKPRSRFRCGVCSKFLPAKGKDDGLTEVCRWCGKVSNYCPKNLCS
ncbi:uncharacterized protein H6S33_005637 [Morchella sextelata]|uniref:uncharacterized protein n=1 Tax=Morchella sextelata TaxID=1174677 RepID=UPI001D041E20|nr:uncharacterized protein H6S33_005637 [Morchella sextelata]KAH0613751.1 hypothetical protein H6S33_005637 [Morchella sextelata]